MLPKSPYLRLGLQLPVCREMVEPGRGETLQRDVCSLGYVLNGYVQLLAISFRELEGAALSCQSPKQVQAHMDQIPWDHEHESSLLLRTHFRCSFRWHWKPDLLTCCAAGRRPWTLDSPSCILRTLGFQMCAAVSAQGFLYTRPVLCQQGYVFLSLAFSMNWQYIVCLSSSLSGLLRAATW